MVQFIFYLLFVEWCKIELLFKWDENIGNFQDFYKMDKICTFPFPGFVVHTSSFCCHCGGVVEAAVHPATVAQLGPPEAGFAPPAAPPPSPSPPSASSWALPPYPCAICAPSCPAQPPPSASLSWQLQTPQSFIFKSPSHSSEQARQPSALPPWPATQWPH